jgi:hypothetical protein
MFYAFVRGTRFIVLLPVFSRQSGTLAGELKLTAAR